MPHPPIDLPPEDFRALGHRLVDDLADFFAAMPGGKVTPAESPAEVRALLPQGGLPERGAPAGDLLREAVQLVTRHSLHNGHPRFFGYITSSAAPLGALADLLAAAVNPNVGSFSLGPVATEIERQVIRWVGELTGFGADAGGILVSGGNMANFVAFLAARRAAAGGDIRAGGLHAARPGVVYASSETHTWLQKAADLVGHGTAAIRYLPVDAEQRLVPEALDAALAEDVAAGKLPLVVVANAGTVSTGAVDPIVRMSEICKRHRVWLHGDGAYGALGAVLPDAPADLKALHLCDSLAVDPHKWLYVPLEAGCTLVKDQRALRDAFTYRPPYYHFDAVAEETVNLFEHGLQNSRGFRALKVWLALRQMGRQGYAARLAEDCALARRLFEGARAHPELEARSHNLSITTLRYRAAQPDATNERLLTAIQKTGEAYLSNAVIEGAFYLRACVVNFRTQDRDIDALLELIVRLGRELSQA